MTHLFLFTFAEALFLRILTTVFTSRIYLIKFASHETRDTNFTQSRKAVRDSQQRLEAAVNEAERQRRQSVQAEQAARDDADSRLRELQRSGEAKMHDLQLTAEREQRRSGDLEDELSRTREQSKARQAALVEQLEAVKRRALDREAPESAPRFQPTPETPRAVPVRIAIQLCVFNRSCVAYGLYRAAHCPISARKRQVRWTTRKSKFAFYACSAVSYGCNARKFNGFSIMYGLNVTSSTGSWPKNADAFNRLHAAQ